jgi:hypothetical protein
MKRMLAALVLLAALAVLFKLSFKPAPTSDLGAPALSASAARSRQPGEASPPVPLRGRYQDADPNVRELVERVASRFGHNADAIERTDGLRGLTLLDRLGLEAVFLYEKRPRDFRRLRDLMGTDAAADLLLHWSEYFGLKRADEMDRGILIAEIARLTPAQQQVAARYPSVLPLILADPEGVTRLVERMNQNVEALGDALAVLSLVSLEQGASDLRTALRAFDDHGAIALEACRKHGLGGLALVSLYGPVLELLGEGVPLDQGLILLQVNADYVDELLRTDRPGTIAAHLRQVAAAGLVEQVAGNPNGLRLVFEEGEPAERALQQAGPDAAEVVFGNFADRTLRRQAIASLAAHGTMALAMLEKYGQDPDFRDILRRYGAAVIPPIAQADAASDAVAQLQTKPRRSFSESLALSALFAAGDDGQAAIRTIKTDGLKRMVQLSQSDVRYYQFLPLYDVTHLANVVARGWAPTSGELTWAMIDGCFVIADVLSLAAVQPEGAFAAEAARSEVKAAVRAGAKTVGRDLAEGGAGSAAETAARRELRKTLAQGTAGGVSDVAGRMQRWWAVRAAGGVYKLLRRLPESLSQLGISQMTQIAGPLCARAGMRASAWRPIRFWRGGVETLLRIPPQKGLKYLAAQAVQAGVGVVGFHRMEEHLRSRRPRGDHGASSFAH